MQGLTYSQVYPSLGLGNASEDAVKVFARFLDIGLAGTLGIQFQGLELVTRLPFIGNGQRDNVQIGQGLHAVFCSGEIEHLDNPLVREVYSVLGAAIALGNPHALLLLRYGITDVFGDILALEEEIPGRCNRGGPFYPEHLVAPAHVNYQLSLHQVSSESDFRGLPARIAQQHLQKGGIHHDVPVIGDKKIVLGRVQPFHSGHAEPAGGLMGDGVDNLVHNPHLKLLHRAAAAHQGRHRLHRHIREEEITDQREILVGNNPLHRSRDFRIYIRPNIFKHKNPFYFTLPPKEASGSVYPGI